MKQLITVLSIFASHCVFSQCKVCFSLEEARISPVQVEELHLSNASFSILDSSFNRFTSLKVLDLSYNPVTEISVTTSLPNLKELNLSHCSYNPWKISAIGKAFPQLEKLDLSYNDLFFMWSGLQSLGNLLQLDVSNNQLNSIPVEILFLSKLKVLNASNNQIQLQGNELGALWSLENLDIHSNPSLNCNDLILTLAENKRLKELAIDGNQLSSKSIQHLSRMNLEHLDLSHVQRPSSIDFTRFSTIRKVGLSHSPDWLSNENASDFRDVANIELTASVLPEALKDLPKLRTLTLNEIDPAQIPRLYALKKLAVLDVVNTAFTKSQVANLQQELPDTRIISKTAEITERMSANRVEPLITIPAKTFTIPSNQETSISEKNVSMNIPENAFLTQSGMPYSGPVSVELTVYADAIQTALAGIPMTFNENGKEEIFASNGMFRFEARGANNEVLKPDPSNLIQVSVGDLQPANSGGLYAFNDRTSQWKTLSDTVSSTNLNERIKRITDSINQLDLKKMVPRAVNERVFSLYPKFSRLDRTQITLYSKYLSVGKNNAMVIQNRNNHVGKTMTKQKWVIDTLVSPEMKRQLKIMKKETFGWRNKKFSGAESQRFIPRLVNNLKLIPDPAHDNFQLVFQYRDSVVNLPVALSGSSNRHIQRNTQRFETGFKTARTKDQKELTAYENSIEGQLETAEEQLRLSLISRAIAMINQSNNPSMLNDPRRLEFGLASFGLVNCDFFQRTPGDYLVQTAPQLIDQEGKQHDTPPQVITVDPIMNFYLETLSAQPVNCFKSSYLVFDLGNKKLGVAKALKGERVKNITLIDIHDKTPDEVSSAILSVL